MITEYSIHLAAQLGYLPEEEQKKLDELREETGKTLHGLNKWVERQLEAGMSVKTDLKGEE